MGVPSLAIARTAALFLVVFALIFGSCAPAVVEGDELDRWIGQMLMVGFRGTELQETDLFLTQLRELQLGGVILFDYDVAARSPVRNIVSLGQVKRLTSVLQSATHHPLFISIDQEGGRVARLKERHGFPAIPSQAALGRLDRVEETRRQAEEVGRRLQDLGINLNFAPVVDLALNPQNPVIAQLERSYGADTALVVRHAEAALRGYQATGILTAIKHFPGHGSSTVDSHLGFTDVSEVWQPVELEPFGRLIEHGLPDMVMTAHLYHEDWHERYPATLSAHVITGILRQQLGFQGVVVSDDLGMGAITQHYTLEETVRLAIEAGVDILLFGNNLEYYPDIAPRAFQAISQLVRSGQVSRQRIRESHTRIMELKIRLAAASGPPP